MVTRKRRSLSVSIATTVAVLVGLVFPFAGSALANHDTRTLDVTPEDASLTVGSTHTLTATLSSPVTSGAVGIDFENESDGSNTPALPDESCNISSGSPGGNSCTVDFTSSTVGTHTWRVWIDHDGEDSDPEADTAEGKDTGTDPPNASPTDADCPAATTPDTEPDCTDVVEVTWTAGPATKLDCDDESGDDTQTNPGGGGSASEETYTCTVTNASDAPVSGATVNVEVKNGVNDPDSPDSESYTTADYPACVTGAPGTCAFTITQADGELGTAIICFWVGTTSAGSGLCGGGDEPTAETENNDLADQVEKTWGAAMGVDAEPETDTNTLGASHSVNATVYGETGLPFPGNTTVSLEFFSGSPSDGDGNDPTPADLSCTTTDDADCTITYTETSTTGTDLMCVWIGAAPGFAGNNTNGTCDGEGLTDADDAAGVFDAPSPETDNQDVVQKIWQSAGVATRLDCSPETATNLPTGSHTVTCTATNSSGGTVSGAFVDAEATGANDPDGNSVLTSPDFSCTTGSGGTCTFSHNPSANNEGTTTYRAWLDADNSNSTAEADTGESQSPDDTDNTDVMTKTWTTSAATILDCNPETDTNAPNTGHTITCTATNSVGATVAGAAVDAEATGTNDPDGNSTLTSPEFTCTTGSNGTCTFTHGSGGTGSTSAVGTTTYRAWLDADSSNSTVEADTSEAQTTVDSDDTDVMTKTWSVTTATTLDCNPETDTNTINTGHTITCTATNSTGAAVAGAAVDAEATGTNDPDGNSTLTSPEFTCTTGTNGTCTFTHGPGGTGTTGTTTYRAWLDADNSNTTVEADTNEALGTVDTDDTDVMTKTWTSGPSSLVLTPNEATNLPGESHVVTATVTDGAGNPVSGATVLWSSSGQGGVGVVSPTTNAQGQVTATVTSSRRGNTFITASTTPCASGGDCEDTAVKHWGPNKCDVFGTSGNDVLNGTANGETLCGFGGNDFIRGRAGNDVLLGGKGRDLMKGGAGSDLLKGGRGADTLRGGSGFDTLKGGRGNDLLNGQGDRDRCIGGPGRDRKRHCGN